MKTRDRKRETVALRLSEYVTLLGADATVANIAGGEAMAQPHSAPGWDGRFSSDPGHLAGLPRLVIVVATDSAAPVARALTLGATTLLMRVGPGARAPADDAVRLPVIDVEDLSASAMTAAILVRLCAARDSDRVVLDADDVCAVLRACGGSVVAEEFRADSLDGLRIQLAKATGSQCVRLEAPTTTPEKELNRIFDACIEDGQVDAEIVLGLRLTDRASLCVTRVRAAHTSNGGDANA